MALCFRNVELGSDFHPKFVDFLFHYPNITSIVFSGIRFEDNSDIERKSSVGGPISSKQLGLSYLVHDMEEEFTRMVLDFPPQIAWCTFDASLTGSMLKLLALFLKSCHHGGISGLIIIIFKGYVSKKSIIIKNSTKDESKDVNITST